MTGWGTGEAQLEAGRVRVEIRSVNQRFLDVRARLPQRIADLTLFTEQAVRERVRRGRVDVVVFADGALVGPPILDKARALAALEALRELRDEAAPGTDVPLGVLSIVPDLFIPAEEGGLEAVRVALRAALEAALDALEASSRREGAALAEDFAARSKTVRALVADVERLSEAARAGMRDRLRERARRLAAEAELSLDAPRLEAEVAMIAERTSITEELTRLVSHLDQLDAAIQAPGPVGRRIDFLLQEMARETNTIGAKAQDASVSHAVVGIKVELERMREQAQNVE